MFVFVGVDFDDCGQARIAHSCLCRHLPTNLASENLRWRPELLGTGYRNCRDVEAHDFACGHVLDLREMILGVSGVP